MSTAWHHSWGFGLIGSQDMQELVKSMLHMDSSELLSYTMRKGSGGAEAEVQQEEDGWRGVQGWY